MQRIRGMFAGVGRYECIAFVTGFVLMAFELIASRILAPSIGSSTYVWTSVIGVMIAALALGYAFGGWLADKRVAVQDVAFLLLLSAMTIGGTLVMYDSVLPLITNFIPDARLQGIVAALSLFMPTSFLLGVISPYLARLRVKSVATAGRSVASLSALNSVGGIVGTFTSGFVLFSYVGSRESMALLVAALLVCSWLLVPRVRSGPRAVVTGVLIVAVTLELIPTGHASALHIDTASSHYRVLTSSYNDVPTKLLVTGPSGAQSGIYTNGSRELVFPYAKAMVKMVAEAPKKDRILMLGGGVYTVPEYLAREYPQSQIDVVEIDPQLEQIAKQYFGYVPPANVRSIADDARAYVAHTTERYDVVLMDAFNEQATPFSLTTREFAHELQSILRPDGVVLVNMIASLNKDCAPLLQSLHASYRSAFGQSVLVAVNDPTFQRRQNVLGVYAATPLDWARVTHAKSDIPQDRAMRLTDNFAPVEPMVQQCR